MKRKNKRVVIAALWFASATVFAETKIKGDQMDVLNKGESIVFTGNVQLDRDGDRVKARRMTTNKNRDKVDAVGNVDLFRRVSATETIQGYGNSAFYNTKSGTGLLRGNGQRAQVIHKTVLSSTMTRIADIKATEFDVRENGASTNARGEVYGKAIDPHDGAVYEFWAEEADYDGSQRKMTLSGKEQPVVKQNIAEGRRMITGDVITYDMDSRHVISSGHARAVLEDWSKKD